MTLDQMHISNAAKACAREAGAVIADSEGDHLRARSYRGGHRDHLGDFDRMAVAAQIAIDRYDPEPKI